MKENKTHNKLCRKNKAASRERVTTATLPKTKDRQLCQTTDYCQKASDKKIRNLRKADKAEASEITATPKAIYDQPKLFIKPTLFLETNQILPEQLAQTVLLRKAKFLSTNTGPKDNLNDECLRRTASVTGKCGN